MKKYLSLILIGLSLPLLAQHQELPEVLVQDKPVKAAEGSRQDSYSGDSLKRFQAVNLAEALKQNSSFFVKSYGANGVATLSLRGTGANHNKVFWNNVDITPANLGLIDLSLIDLNSSENLNIAYGAGALPEGSGSLGAGFQISSQVDWQKKARTNVGLNFGEPIGLLGSSVFTEYGGDTWRAQTSISHLNLRNNFRYRIPGDRDREHRLENADLEQWHLKQNFYFRPNSRSLWSIKTWYNQSLRALPSNILGDPARSDAMQDRNLYLTGDYQWTSGDLHFFGNLAWVKSQNHFRSYSEEHWDHNDYQSWQSQQRLVWSKQKWFWEAAWQNRFDQVNSSSYEAIKDRFSSSLYLRGKYQWNAAWTSTIQIRQESYDQDFSPLLGSFVQSFQANENWQFSLSLSRNYRLPSLNDLYWNRVGNPNLEPEESYQGELGLNWQDSVGEWHLELAINAYWMEVENWIQWSPTQGIWQPRNLKAVQNKGIENRITFKKRWSSLLGGISADHQWISSINQNPNYEQEGSLPYVPVQSFNFSSFLNWQSWWLRYQLNYSDRYFLDEANRYYLPSYAVQNIQIGYRLKRGKHQWEFNFGLHNLADIDYQIIPWRPEPGLNYRIGIRWQWEE